MKERLLAALALAGLCVGGGVRLAGHAHLADEIWGVIAALSVVPLGLAVLRSLKRRDVGVDAIALVAITTAVVLGEELAAAIVALMMSGGAALEAWASTRARRALHLLVERAPRTARRVEDNTVTEIDVDALVPGDLALVLKGEVVPADGLVEGDEAVIDESTLTGEPLPIVARHGHPVRSGAATRVTRSNCASYGLPPRAHTHGWSSSFARPRRIARRLCALPTATRRSSCPSHSRSPERPARSPETPDARSPFSSSRRRVR